MNSRFTCNLAVFTTPRRWTLVACFLALLIGPSASSVVWAEDFVPTSLATSVSDLCTGESVTFTADVPDASDDNPVTHVPWQIFFNGDLLSDSELATYVTLDAAVGTTLDAWSDSTYLTSNALGKKTKLTLGPSHASPTAEPFPVTGSKPAGPVRL